MALPSFLIGFLKAQTTAAANTALASEPLRTLATAAELRAGTQTAVRSYSPDLFKEQSGTTAARPTDGHVGFRYFDTTLGKPVFLKVVPSTWVTADGVAA